MGTKGIIQGNFRNRSGVPYEKEAFKGILLPLLVAFSLIGLGCSTKSNSTKGKAGTTPPESDGSGSADGSALSLKIFDGSGSGSSEVSALEINEGSSVVFVVSLSSAQGSDTQLALEISATSGSTSDTFSGSFPISKTIAKGATSTSVTLATTHDSRYSGNKTFQVNLSVPGTSVATSFNLVVNDLETKPEVGFSAGSQTVSEADGSGTATVQLQTAVVSAVTVNYTFVDDSALNGTHYSGTNGTLSFAAGETTKTVSFSLQNDASFNASRVFHIVLSSVSGLADIGSTNDQAVAITNEDSAMGDFTITGITSSQDSTSDDILSNATTPTLTWTTSTSATSYDVSIYDDNGTTLRCSAQNTNLLTLDLGGGCSLTAGQYYKAKVTAKLSSQTHDASNSLYRFYVNQSPVAGSGGEGPWYVMAGSSITINAQWAGSPAVGVATDAEGHALTFTAKSDGSLGAVSNSGASLVYTASSSSVYGRDTFTYTLADEKGGLLSGTIVVHVMQVHTWTGKVSSAWSAAGNWCGSIDSNKKNCAGASAAPTGSDVAFFDDTCTSGFSCTPSTGANTSLEGVKMKSNGFTQASGHTLTLGTSGWVQNGGSFSGGDSLIQTPKFELNSGTFTSTSGELKIYGNSQDTSFTFGAGGNFVHHSGLLTFENLTSWTTSTVSLQLGSTLSVYNLKFSTISGGGANWTTYIANSGAQVDIQKDLTFSSGAGLSVRYLTMNLKGDVYSTGDNLNVDGAYYSSMTSKILMSGTINQYYFISGTGHLPKLEVNKSSGQVLPGAGTTAIYLEGLDLQNSTFVAPALGLVQGRSVCATPSFSVSPGATYTHNNSVMRFKIETNWCGSSGNISFGNNVELYDLEFVSSHIGGAGGSTWFISDSDVLYVANNFTYVGVAGNPFRLRGGTIHVKKDISTSGATLGGTTVLVLDGTTDQYYETFADGIFPKVTVNKSSGQVLPEAGTTFPRFSSLDLIQGNFQAPTNGTVQIYLPTSYFNPTQSFTVGASASFLHNGSGLSFNHFMEYGNVTGTIDLASSLTIPNLEFVTAGHAGNVANWTMQAGNRLVVSNNFSVNSGNSFSLNSGVLEVRGNSTLSGNISGTSQLEFTGTSNQSLSSGSYFFTGDVTVNKASGSFDLASALNLTGASQLLSVSQGNVNMSGFNLTTPQLSLNANTLTKSGGTLTVGGSVVGTGSLFGGTVAP